MAISSLADFKVSGPTRNHRGVRKPNPLKYVVIHSAVCCGGSATGAEALARYLRDGAGGRRVSWHYSTDKNSVASSLDEIYAGRHTGSSFVDTHSIAIEMAVYVPGEWDITNYKQTLDKTAELTADICIRNNITPELLTATQLRDGQNGIISHNLSRIVYGGTTHTDPGPTFPWDIFAKKVTSYFNAQKAGGAPVIIDEDTAEQVEPRALRRGDSGSAVGFLQSGFGLKVDGAFGPITEAAVRGFQLAQRTELTGVASIELQEALQDPEAEWEVKTSRWLPQNLYRGKSGSALYKAFVGIWQERFGLEPDGIFDKATQAATLGFQSGVPGLEADGVVGRSTWGTLFLP